MERNHVRAFVGCSRRRVFWMVFEQAGSTLNVFAENVPT